MPTYEELIKELEEIIQKLEDKEISLEDSVKYYTRGIDLVKQCSELLDDKEKVIVAKMTEAGLVDFVNEDNKDKFDQSIE